MNAPTISNETAPPVAQLCAVTKSFTMAGGHELKVLDNIDLAVNPGEFLALLGQSGSGKSTILRCLTGLIQPSSGRAMCNGKSLSGILADASVVFQTFALFPWLTVEQNVAVGLMSRHMDRAERDAAVERAIELIGLGNYHTAFPRELSGGMRQRAMLAIALCGQPRLLIADEPTSALDASLSRNTMDLLLELTEDAGASLLIISHDILLCQDYADTTMVMRHGDIVETGSSSTLASSAVHPYTIGLLRCVPTLDSAGFDELPTFDTLDPLVGAVGEGERGDRT